MGKILVILPAGETYDHDCVRWYNHRDVARSIDHYHNIGDAFVHDSSLKLLDYDQIDAAKIMEPTQADIDRYNAEYDYVFLRGSNYIHEHMRWQRAADLLEGLKIPVIAFGIGAQAPKCGPLVLSDDSQRVLRLIADRCHSVGVRGAYTAQVLSDLGIRNLRIIGCPTAFRRRNPNLRIRLPPLEQVRRVGVTVRREVSPGYSPDIRKYLNRHRDLIEAMAARFEVTLMAQGEIEEKKLAIGTPEHRQQAQASLAANAWAQQWYLSQTVRDLYTGRLFYSDVVADYEALVQSLGLVLGYRLHGNLIALANGVPSVYFTYDSRTAEFAETFQIPRYSVYADQPFDLEDYWDQARFDGFNRAYQVLYWEMVAFLEENRCPHRLRPLQPAEPLRLAV